MLMAEKLLFMDTLSVPLNSTLKEWEQTEASKNNAMPLYRSGHRAVRVRGRFKEDILRSRMSSFSLCPGAAGDSSRRRIRRSSRICRRVCL